jgi:hypothetical protein
VVYGMGMVDVGWNFAGVAPKLNLLTGGGLKIQTQIVHTIFTDSNESVCARRPRRKTFFRREKKKPRFRPSKPPPPQQRVRTTTKKVQAMEERIAAAEAEVSNSMATSGERSRSSNLRQD